MTRKQFNSISFAGLALPLLLSCGNDKPPTESCILPKPVAMEQDHGKGFTFSGSTSIAVENEAQAAAARNFAELFAQSAGFTPKVDVGNKEKGDISLVTDKSLAPEAYTMNVTPKKIEIKSADTAGFFYALQSLRLSLPPAIDGNRQVEANWTVPPMKIDDKPRFAYRGLMLDVARFFMPKDEVIKLIDCMAMLKLNKLHMHLSDDTGWRLEIKRYPKLTEVGAWRVDRGEQPFYARRNQQPGEKTPVGGFYTQNEMKEIIAYAAERQIEVIPEIDVPAHSCAALAAYPELACPVVKTPITVLPGLGGKHPSIIYCAGKEETFRFLEGVIDELADLFPSQYIHMGGDEAAKTYWKQCPLCQERMRREKLANEEDLQGYFMGRLNEYIRSKGKTMMGWDELTNSKVPEGTVVFGWQGYGKAALKAAEEGHPFIMAPARVLYLIRYQGPQWFEPTTYFGNNTLKDVYNFEPVQKDWKPEYKDLLKGIQACMWTEFCYKPSDVTYLTFPRLAAAAEVAWSPEGSKDWEAFQKALDNYLAHLDAKGIVYAKSMFNIQHKVTPLNGKLNIKLECERTDVEIRYTVDGTEPAAESPLFKDSLLTDKAMTLKCATFKDGKQMGKTLELPLLRNKATGKKVISSNPQTALLTNGVRGSLRQSDFEWCTWDKLEQSSFTVDLGQTETIGKVTLGCLTNYGMAVHKPKKITLELSEDNRRFTEAGKKTFDKDEIFKEGNYIEDIAFDVKGKQARYVRIKTEGYGKCIPEHYMRPGQPARYYFDELTVE